ncbi:uncharacterized protein G2W53_023744 [Senna tora]|uniref:Uncharacterized protein n=1 Tax=Senna tora TaxID=362788 RepID=A0A834TB74_9FABA|nr:uncharacterized protein G2W53_023744 [Senna tora]
MYKSPKYHRGIPYRIWGSACLASDFPPASSDVSIAEGGKSVKVKSGIWNLDSGPQGLSVLGLQSYAITGFYTISQNLEI